MAIGERATTSADREERGERAGSVAAQPGPRPSGRLRGRLLAILTVLAVVFALKLSSSVTVPLTAGVLSAALVWPVVRRLRRRVPEWLAVTAAFFVVLLVLAAFIATVAWSVQAIADDAPKYAPRVQQIRRQLAATAGRFGLQVPDPIAPTDARGGAPGAAGATREQGPSAFNGVAKRAATIAYSALGGLVLALAFAALGLAEASETRRKIARRLAGHGGEGLLEIGERIAAAFRRYFLVKTATSAITGAASGLLALAFGLDFAFLWGLLAFLFEFVPTLGSLLAVVPPSLFALLQFEGWQKPLAVLAAYTVMQIVLGNFVDPKIEGRYMSLSPFAVLLSIVLWAWVWGAPGALLGVPLTVAAVVTCQHFDRTRWIAALLTQARTDGSDDEESSPADRESGDRRD